MAPSPHTTAHVHFSTAGRMEHLADEAVDLIVTSPPYPMIEMWDAAFAAQDPSINTHLECGASRRAFEAMHALLDVVWKECTRVLREGGLLCINVGDATRTVDGNFQLFANHARILQACTDLGLKALPGILWRKSTNKPTKFMGSGMIPPNAYVTLEHEHILIFRKGERRAVAHRANRYESAYFWEERNRWFSDVWTDLTGISQDLPANGEDLRERSAAFPLMLPYRLIAMFSVLGDTVLDPFWGTGTTSLAAALLARQSVGYEIDPTLEPFFNNALSSLPVLSRTRNRERLAQHEAFLVKRDTPCRNRNATYDVDVVTRQERTLTLYDITNVEATGRCSWRFGYEIHRR